MDEFLHHFTYCYKLAAVEALANCPEDNAMTGYPFPRLTPWNPGGRRRWLVAVSAKGTVPLFPIRAYFIFKAAASPEPQKKRGNVLSRTISFGSGVI
jgi:hypothetical protein